MAKERCRLPQAEEWIPPRFDPNDPFVQPDPPSISLQIMKPCTGFTQDEVPALEILSLLKAPPLNITDLDTRPQPMGSWGLSRPNHRLPSNVLPLFQVRKSRTRVYVETGER